jgi:hypothetical protein
MTTKHQCPYGDRDCSSRVCASIARILATVPASERELYIIAKPEIVNVPVGGVRLA